MLIDRSFCHLLSGGADEADPRDRRAATRVSLEVDVVLGAGGHVWSAVSGNVSVGGLYVATYRSVRPWTRVSVRFALATGPIAGVGLVRWVHDGRPGRLPGMGIELVDVDLGDHRRLRLFCEKRARLLSYEEIVTTTH